jgi:uncharacterized protein
MQLEGVVTNIVAFGAFVDVGVHQDGLVHVSQLADRYVADPNDVVKVGQKVQVRVMSVDLERNRIALTMKREGGKAGGREASGAAQPGAGRPSQKQRKEKEKAAPKQWRAGDVAPNGIRFK